MSKYNNLWIYFKSLLETDNIAVISFNKVQDILGFPIDHSFLTYKKELNTYDIEIKKISLKNKTIIINKIRK